MDDLAHEERVRRDAMDYAREKMKDEYLPKIDDCTFDFLNFSRLMNQRTKIEHNHWLDYWENHSRKAQKKRE